jgi:hypothetical protein
MTDMEDMTVARPVVRHVFLALVLLAAFLVMASVFVPDRLQADEPGGSPASASAPHSAAVRDSLPSLGQLVSDRYRVTVHATPDGPLYSVYDRQGVELAALLTAAQIAEQFDDLPLPDARAGAPIQVMDTDTGGPDWE